VNQKVQAPGAELKTVIGLLDAHKTAIKAMMPQHMTPERMLRFARVAYSRTPELTNCEVSSVCAAIVQSSLMGLECDGISGEAYLVPFWHGKARRKECQLQVGYQGLVKMARNSGEYQIIDAQAVHENDDFDFAKGSDTYLKHTWNWKQPRGAVMGYYSTYTLVGGATNFEFMTMAEIEDHRDQYSQGAFKRTKEGQRLIVDGKPVLQGPWKDSPHWMYCKTPLKRLLKLGPRSTEMRRAMALDDSSERGEGQLFPDVPVELQPPTFTAVAEPEEIQEGEEIPPGTDVKISAENVARLRRIASESGWHPAEVQEMLTSKFQVESFGDLSAGQLALAERLLNGGTE
jgi:recombination protein RecT